MAFITISREFGSLGTTISQNVAQSLNYAYIDRTIFEKVLEQYGIVSFHKFYSSPHSFWDRLEAGNKEIMGLFNNTILALSKLDNTVFVGRAGFVLLHDYENVFHVLIKAPFEKRVSNVMESLRLTNREEAATLVMQHDYARSSFIKTFYKADQNDAGWFDLVIDTDSIPADVAEKWIAEAVGYVEKKKVAPEKSTLSIEADRILQMTISDVIKAAEIRKAEMNP